MSESSNNGSSILGKELLVICMGVSTFADDLEKQGVKKVVRVDWKPPATDDEEILELLDKLGP
ncbi:MAG TPA: hypothetical protein VFF30_19200 [Nitrososphaerales archaeon]|nr:hypothetical protein [Nitrososphaerales archaeon]